MSGQLLSCLCVSVPSRWGLLQRAVLDFCRQDYANKELIVAVKDDNYAAQIHAYLDALNGLARQTATTLPIIKVFARPGHDVAGVLLYALAQARGDFISLWSDDNQNLSRRLSAQMEWQLAVPASTTVLTDCFYHFFDTHELFWTRFENPSAPIAERCATSTLICPRDLLPPLTPFVRDHPASKLLAVMAGTVYCRKIHFLPPSGLFMAGVRGDNLRGYDVHRRLAVSLPMTYKTAMLKDKEQLVTSILDEFYFDHDVAAVAVCGPDKGAAFSYPVKLHYPDYLFPVGEPVGVKKIDERVGNDG